MTEDDNENWRECPQCGARRLINPATGKIEPCAHCLSLKSPGGLFGGSFAIALGVIVVAILVVFGIRLLLG
jgi:hypothetical protein